MNPHCSAMCFLPPLISHPLYFFPFHSFPLFLSRFSNHLLSTLCLLSSLLSSHSLFSFTMPPLPSSSPLPPSPPLPLLWAIRIHYRLSWFMAQSHIIGEHGGMPINLQLHVTTTHMHVHAHTNTLQHKKYTACIHTSISKTWITEHSAWNRAWTSTHTHSYTCTACNYTHTSHRHM